MSLPDRPCSKCPPTAVVAGPAVLSTRDADYCAACLRADMYSRFARTFLSRGSALVKGRALCLAWSGGPSSSLLLHFVRSFVDAGKSEYVKAQFSRVFVCIVDCSCLLEPACDNAKLDAIESDFAGMKSVAESMGFEFLRVPVESVFDTDVVLGFDDDRRLKLRTRADGATPKSLFLDLFASFKTTPAKNPTTSAHLLQTLVSRLLTQTALMHGCATLMYGPNATSIAANIVSQTAIGGGFTLPNEISLEYCVPDTDLVVVRPIRDILWAEIEKLCDLEKVSRFDNVSKMTQGLFGGIIGGSMGSLGGNVSKLTVQDLAL
ncbi:hypothetical protein HDU83_005955, partial [Entophlyctis luteolus]